uniref:Uncharacterized protein n=1 Tax=Brassica oleracea TaxID=3712 RepID=A0A3P6DSH7_BRAOL|nr:unnamed protein product [Brassica oleracea]
MLSGLQHHSCSTSAKSFSILLAKSARFFHRELHFIGCSIPVWLPKPPQA